MEWGLAYSYDLSSGGTLLSKADRDHGPEYDFYERVTRPLKLEDDQDVFVIEDEEGDQPWRVSERPEITERKIQKQIQEPPG